MSRAPLPADREDLAEVFLRVGPRMKRFLARRRVSAEEAEDLLQDTFLGLVRHWHAVQCPEAWLMGAIRLRFYQYLRTRRRNGWLVYMEPSRLKERAPEVEAPQAKADLLWDLMALGRLLPRSHWLLVYFRYALGLSSGEIAALLGCSPNSIRALSGRILARLPFAVPDRRSSGPEGRDTEPAVRSRRPDRRSIGPAGRNAEPAGWKSRPDRRFIGPAGRDAGPAG